MKWVKLLINWRLWVWFVLILGWTIAFFAKTKNLATLEYFVGVAVITVTYIITVAIFVYTQKFIPIREVKREFAIILASVIYYVLFKFSAICSKFSIFNEEDLLTGFTIGLVIGVLYMVADLTRSRG